MTDTAQGGTNLGHLLDIPLQVTIELGRTRMPIHELLSVGPGSVLELSKAAGEPLDILVNGRPVARGEAVVVNERFGVRITEVLSAHDRISSLGEEEV